MAGAAFPLAKLGFLIVRQASRPIANSITRRARASTIFRDWICVPTAQAFHWCDVKVRMRILGLGLATSIPKLNEQKAIETGAQLLSELIILSIASSILFYEYKRQMEKEELKQSALDRERSDIKDKIISLEIQVKKQSSSIDELERLMSHLREELINAKDDSS